MDWLTICADGATTPCVAPVQAAYLVGVGILALLLVVAGRRSRDFATATLSLMAVAIAINIALGSVTALLRLPLYLDSVGTVLVGALAGPWAGALTGLLSDLVWSLLPIPGGAGPTTAFFAPVAAAVGLIAGFWASRGVFGLRSGDDRIGGFLALALGFAAAVVALLVAQATVGVGPAADSDSQVRFAVTGLVMGLYLIGATAISAAAVVFAVIRLLFAPSAYFSTATFVLANDAGDPTIIDLRGLALPDPLGLVVALVVAVAVAALAVAWARRGEHARFFPVWVAGATTGVVAALIAAPIAAGVFGGVTGGGTDLLVALFRTLGLGVIGSVLAQGLTSDPLDKTITFTVVFVILTALPITVRTMFSRGALTVDA